MSDTMSSISLRQNSFVFLVVTIECNELCFLDNQKSTFQSCWLKLKQKDKVKVEKEKELVK